jgi:hypothetical protein
MADDDRDNFVRKSVYLKLEPATAVIFLNIMDR